MLSKILSNGVVRLLDNQWQLDKPWHAICGFVRGCTHQHLPLMISKQKTAESGLPSDLARILSLILFVLKVVGILLSRLDICRYDPFFQRWVKRTPHHKKQPI